MIYIAILNYSTPSGFDFITEENKKYFSNEQNLNSFIEKELIKSRDIYPEELELDDYDKENNIVACFYDEDDNVTYTIKKEIQPIDENIF